jgi:LysM repeat protein
MATDSKRIVAEGGTYSQEQLKEMQQQGVLPKSESIQTSSDGAIHKVSKGDSAAKIAKKYGLKLEELLAANPELAKNPDKVSIGTKINVPRKADINAAKELQKQKEAQGEEWSLDRVLGNIKREGGKALEQAGNLPGKAMDFIKENPMAVGSAANLLGGVAGYGLSQQATDEAFKDIGRARKGYEGVQQQVQGVKANEDLMAARKAAIEGIKQRSEMGLTPEDQAMLRQVQAQQLRQGAAGRQAAEEAASRRGAQGGQDIMAALQGAGQAQQTASEQADRLAATSFQAKQQALKDLATASQTGITGDFSQDLARAKAAADIQENIGQTYGTEATMQGKKAEQLGNLGVKAGEAISTPLMYSAMQKDRMEKAPAPEEPKQDPITEMSQRNARPSASTKKDKSVAGQATKAVKKVQDTVSKAQNTVNQAQQLGNLVGQAVGQGRTVKSTINTAPAKVESAIKSMTNIWNKK